MTNTVTLLPNGRQQFFNGNGDPLVGGTVGTYVPSTLTAKTTYQDSTGNTPNTNPITLDAIGSAAIWGSGYYRQIVNDSNGNEIWDVVTLSPILGVTGTGLILDSVAELEAATIDSTVNAVTLSGYYVAGDEGGGLYSKSSGPSAPGKVQSADGTWWELVIESDGVNVYQFGAKGDGITYDTAAFIAAASFLSPGGGVINMNAGRRHHVGTTYLQPFSGVTLKGPYSNPGVVAIGGTSQFSEMGAILVDSTPISTTITTTASSTTATVSSSVGLVQGMVIEQANINVGTYIKTITGTDLTLSQAAVTTGNVSGNFYPTVVFGGNSGTLGVFIAPYDVTLPAQDSTTYTGSAITAGGDDIFCKNTLIVGFNRVYASNGYGRANLDDFYFDGNNGIYIENSYDSVIIDHYHGWVFGTIDAYSAALNGGGSAADNAYRIQRNGTGLNLQQSNANTTLGTGLILGYMTNYAINATTISADTIWSDDSGFHTGSSGVVLGMGVNAFQCANMYCFNSSVNFTGEIGANNSATINNGYFSSSTNQNVVFYSGDFTFGQLYSSGSAGGAISMSTTSSRIQIETLVDYNNTFPQTVELAVTGIYPQYVQIGRVLSDKPNGNSLVGGNPMTLLPIPSADPLPLPLLGTTFEVTGTTPFSTILGGGATQEIWLLFPSGGSIVAGGNTTLTTTLTLSAGEIILIKYIPNLTLWHIVVQSS